MKTFNNAIRLLTLFLCYFVFSPQKTAKNSTIFCWSAGGGVQVHPLHPAGYAYASTYV